MRDVLITSVLNGYSIKVGCQTVVFQSKDSLLTELSRYLDDPKKVEAEYLKSAKYERQDLAEQRTPTPAQNFPQNLIGNTTGR